MKPGLCALLILLPGGLWGQRTEVKFPVSYPPTNEIVMENLVAIPMRDGVKLYADVYRPAKPGKYPVLVSRTPYSTERAPTAYEAAVFFSRRGYVFVFQDVRGRHESEGKWEPFRNDIEDGYDTVEWAAKQPWSNGKVGMEGGSYLGQVQWRAAHGKPAAPGDDLAEGGRRRASITTGSPLNGGWRLSFNFGWGPVRQESRIMQNTGPHAMAGGPEGISFDKVLWHLPLMACRNWSGRNAQFYRDWIAASGLRRLLEEAECRGDLRPDRHSRAHHRAAGSTSSAQGTLHGYVGMSHTGKTETARKMSHIVDRSVGTRFVAEDRRHRFRARRARRYGSASSCAGTTTG